MFARNAVLLAAAFAAPLQAQAPAPVSAPPGINSYKSDAPSALRPETYRLWLGRAPLATADTPEQVPTVTVVRPYTPMRNGAAVVIAPGGGYISLASALEGTEPAAWFASRGVTAFVLSYRVRPFANLPAPLLDGARAIRFVRANAAQFGLDPARIGMMGFSAGGHLAASVAADPPPADAGAADAIDRVSSRPDFLVLGYPWLEATKVNAQGKSSYCVFGSYLKLSCEPSDYVDFDPLKHVSGQMPPTFIYHTTNDSLVPVHGSTAFFEAMVAQHADVELHAFASGPHGSGLGASTSSALAHWPELLDEWLRAHGVLARAARGAAASAARSNGGATDR